MSVVCEFKTYDDEDGEHLCTRRMGALPRVGDLVSMTGKEVEHPNYPDEPVDFEVESVTWELNTDDTDEEIIESPTVWLVPKCGTFLRNSTKRFQADVERERAEENRAIGKPSPPRLIGSVVYDNTDVAYVFDHVLNDEDRNIFERGLFERHGPPGSRLTYEEQRRFNELERHARKEKATTRSE